MSDRAPLDRLISYNPETGALVWLPRTIDMFSAGKQSAEQNCAIWNGKFAGKPAISAPDKRGYLTGHLFGKPVKAHRIAWEIAHGSAPEGEIDHINGNPADNRLANLRVVSHKENGRNLRLKKNNTTGVCGIFQRPSGRWGAHLQVDGRNITIGTFDSKAAAAAARKAAEVEYGFHINHGVAR